MELTPEFVSLGVNRVVGALDWGDSGLVAYGGHHIVCIYDPEVRWDWALKVQAVARMDPQQSMHRLRLGMCASGGSALRIPRTHTRAHHPQHTPV